MANDRTIKSVLELEQEQEINYLKSQLSDANKEILILDGALEVQADLHYEAIKKLIIEYEYKLRK